MCHTFFSGHNFSSHNWCVCILKRQTFIWDLFQPSVRQLYLFFRVVIFSGGSKNIASQMNVPFFLVVIFSGCNWCSYFDTSTNYGTYIRLEKVTTVGFTIFPYIVALVQKITYVECTQYVHWHTPATASSRQPQTTNKRTMAEASGFCYHNISYISWPNLMFETRKFIRSICSGHPLNLFCIGGLQMQFSVEVCLLLAQS